MDKLKQAHKIDIIVALSMAALAAVRGQDKPGYDLFAPGLYDDSAGPRQGVIQQNQATRTAPPSAQQNVARQSGVIPQIR